MNEIESYESRENVRLLIEAGHTFKEAYYFVKENPGASLEALHQSIQCADCMLLKRINSENWFCVHHKTLPKSCHGVCKECSRGQGGANSSNSSSNSRPTTMALHQLEIACLSEFYEMLGFDPYVVDIVLSRRMHNKLPIDANNVLDALVETRLSVERTTKGGSTTVTVTVGVESDGCGKKREDFYEKFHSKEYCEKECVVCFEKMSDTLFEPCGHKAVCFNCANDIVRLSGTCPLCSSEIRKIIKMN